MWAWEKIVRAEKIDWDAERERERDVSASTPSSVTDDGVDAETSLSFSLHLYLSSPPLHFFSRSLFVFILSLLLWHGHSVAVSASLENSAPSSSRSLHVSPPLSLSLLFCRNFDFCFSRPIIRRPDLIDWITITSVTVPFIHSCNYLGRIAEKQRTKCQSHAPDWINNKKEETKENERRKKEGLKCAWGTLKIKGS